MKTLSLLFPIALLVCTTSCRAPLRNHPAKHIDWIANAIDTELALSAAQKPAFYSPVATVHVHVKAHVRESHAALADIRTTLTTPQLDFTRIVAITKARVRAQPSEDELEDFIDACADFVAQLSSQQQHKLAKLIAGVLNWIE